MTQSQIREIQRNHSQKHRKNEKKVQKLINLVFAKQANIISTFAGNHGIGAAISHITHLITQQPIQDALRRSWIAVSRDYHNITLLTKKSEGKPGIPFLAATPGAMPQCKRLQTLQIRLGNA